MDILDQEEQTLLINLLTSVGFFVISGLALYFCTSLRHWCKYGRETLAMVGFFIGTIGIVRMVRLCGLISVDDASLINGFVSIGFAIGIILTIYVHRTVHKTREACGLPPTNETGPPKIPALHKTVV